jgi:carboxylesterase 2
MESAQRARVMDVLEATTWPNQCAQTSLTDAVFTTTRGNASEDCLYLNVWTPTYNATTLADITGLNLPVYLWIFGGCFSVASANVQT